MKNYNRLENADHTVLKIGPDENDPEQLERTIFLPAGFPYLSLLTIGEMLDGEGVFVPGYVPPSVGPCHPAGLLFEAQVESVETILLPDRNIASRMAAIVTGASMNPMLRKIAAVKAFCHFLDIQIEPSIAFHELAHVQGNDVANLELARFRDADNSDPYPWLDLALGDLDALEPLQLSAPPAAYDLAFPLRRWTRNYVVALKIAELEFANLANIDKILTLIAWMRDDFIVAGPAAFLACIYFAPNSPPRKGLFKQLWSPTRQRAIEGIRNAAWDLTHLSEFIRRVNDAHGQSNRVIFASFDGGLRSIARHLLAVSADEFSEERTVESLVVWWDQAHAERIARSLGDVLAEINDENRKLRQRNSASSIDDMIRDGERLVMSASKGRF